MPLGQVSAKISSPYDFDFHEKFYFSMSFCKGGLGGLKGLGQAAKKYQIGPFWPQSIHLANIWPQINAKNFPAKIWPLS